MKQDSKDEIDKTQHDTVCHKEIETFLKKMKRTQSKRNCPSKIKSG